MQRFRNILMVYNDDEAHRPALAHVIDLARRTGARLTLADITEDLHIEAQATYTALPDDILQLRREDIEINLGLRVKRVLACRRDILQGLRRHYGVGAETVGDPGDLGRSLKAADESGEPRLIEVYIENKP